MIESIKKAFILSVKAVKLFYVLAAFNIITNILSSSAIGIPGCVRPGAGWIFSIVIFVILFSLIGIFIQGGAFAYVKELIKAGSASLASFVDNGKKYFLRLLGVSIILFGTLGLFLGIFTPIIFNLAPALKGIIIIIVALLTIALMVLFIMPAYALVGSNLGVIESIQKGVLVGKKNFFKILGILAIMMLIGIALMVVGLLIDFMFSFIARPAASFISTIVMAVVNAALAVLANIAFMDFYLKSITEENPQS